MNDKVINLAERRRALTSQPHPVPKLVQPVPSACLSSVPVLSHPLASAFIQAIQKELPSTVFLGDLPRIGAIREKLARLDMPKRETLLNLQKRVSRYSDEHLKNLLQGCTDSDLTRRPAFWSAICYTILKRVGAIFEPTAPE